MKTSIFPFTTILIIVLLSVVFSSCHKTVSSIKPPTGTSLSPCRLTDEDNTGYFGYRHYWYTYTEEGKVDSIYYSEYAPSGHSAPVAFCRQDGTGFLWKSYLNVTAQSPPETFDYVYNSLLQDSSQMPTTLETNFTLFDGISTPSGGYSFQYKANGLLDGFVQHNAKPLTGIEYGLGTGYDENGDIQFIKWDVITGPRLTAKATATGYDKHPSPWAGSIATYAFVSPSINWTSSEYDPLFFALSAHNPTGSVYTTGADKEWEEKYAYEYNDRGQPTSRTTVRTTTNGGLISTRQTYTYNCN